MVFYRWREIRRNLRRAAEFEAAAWRRKRKKKVRYAADADPTDR